MSKVRADRYTNRADDGAPTFSQGVNVVGSGVSIGIGASVYSPANNQLVLGTDSTERVRIASNGNVGINSSIPNDKLTVYNYNIGNPTGITVRNTEATSTYSHARLRLESQNGAAYGEIWVDVANAGLRLGYNSSSTVKIDSTGNIVLLNGRGIDFSATGDGSGTMTSELLDDYEEGTWTPTTYSDNLVVAFANYVKIGNTCTVNFKLDGVTSYNAATTNPFYVFSFPFNCAGSGGHIAFTGSSFMHSIATNYTNNLVAIMESGFNRCRFANNATNATTDTIDLAQVGTGSWSISCSITYITV